MNHKNFVVRLAFVAVLFILAVSISNARETITLQTGWKFTKGTVENAMQVDFNDSKWQDVMVPHDWAIAGPTEPNGDGNTGKLPWRDQAWYRRNLEITPEWSGKTIYLLFDGVMSNPEIYINGKLAGKWDYGYNSFYLDITEWLNIQGKNKLAVHVDNREHDSRWYPGAGIYRKVQMISCGSVHIGIWGTQITTPIVKPNYAEVRIMTTVNNKSGIRADKVRVENIILNPTGTEVGRKETTGSIHAKASSDY